MPGCMLLCETKLLAQINASGPIVLKFSQNLYRTLLSSIIVMFLLFIK